MAKGCESRGRVLLALMLREAQTRFGRHKLGYLWAVVEPIAHVVMFIALFSFLQRTVALGDSIPMFLATGFATYFGFYRVMNRTEGGYRSNEALLTFPPVKVLDVFVGRALLELATWIVDHHAPRSAALSFSAMDLRREVFCSCFRAILGLFLIAFGIGMFLGILTEFIPSTCEPAAHPDPHSLFDLSASSISRKRSIPAIAGYRGVESRLCTASRCSAWATTNTTTATPSTARYLFVWAIGSLLLGLATEFMARKALRAIV